MTSNFLAAYLCHYDFRATSIHSASTEDQQETVLHEFEDGMWPMLMATHLICYNFEIAGVDYVTNYQLRPSLKNTYTVCWALDA